MITKQSQVLTNRKNTPFEILWKREKMLVDLELTCIFSNHVFYRFEERNHFRAGFNLPSANASFIFSRA